MVWGGGGAGGGGENFIRPSGTLKVSPTLGRELSEMGGFRIFHTFSWGGATGFSLMGGWGESLPH